MPRISEKMQILIKRFTPVRTIVRYRYVRNGCRCTLDCGHIMTIEGPNPPPQENVLECIACGKEEAKKFAAVNPNWLSDKERREKFHRDGRPKPKFRTSEGEVKFLKRLARQRGEA